MWHSLQLSLTLLAIGFSGISCETDIPLSAPTTLPRPDNVVVVILENKSIAQVYDTSIAPFIQTLVQDSNTAVFMNSLAMGHPSQPNYLWMISGDNQLITTNDRPPYYFTTPNLAASLLNAGFTFATFSEGLPYTGFDGDTYGLYVRKHNPVTNWVGTDSNQVPPEVNRPFSEFPDDFSELPTFSYVVPDMINGMHDGSITQGDTWLQENMSDLIEYARTHNMVFMITFDETGYDVTDNRILTLAIGGCVKGGIYDTPVSHVNWLRTFEEMYGLPHAGLSSELYPMTECWKNP